MHCEQKNTHNNQRRCWLYVDQHWRRYAKIKRQHARKHTYTVRIKWIKIHNGKHEEQKKQLRGNRWKERTHTHIRKHSNAHTLTCSVNSWDICYKMCCRLNIFFFMNWISNDIFACYQERESKRRYWMAQYHHSRHHHHRQQNNRAALASHSIRDADHLARIQMRMSTSDAHAECSNDAFLLMIRSEWALDSKYNNQNVRTRGLAIENASGSHSIALFL